MATDKTTSPVSPDQPMNTDERFLGVMNPECREAALSMPLPKLAVTIEKCLAGLADSMRRGGLLTELIIANQNEADTVDAIASAMQPSWFKIDNSICALGGYLEALIVRAQGGSHG